MENLLDQFQEFKSETLESIALLDLAQKVLASGPLDKALELLAFHSNITKKMTTNDGESIVIFEILPSGKILSVFHPDPEISGKYIEQTVEYFHQTSQYHPGAKHLDEIINEAVAVYKNNPIDYQKLDYIRHDPNMTLGKSYDHCAKDFSNQRRLIFTLKEYEGHTLLIAIGFFKTCTQCNSPCYDEDDIVHYFRSDNEDKIVLASSDVITIKRRYDDNRKMKSVMRFLNGRLDGDSIIYNDGKVRKQTRYCQGRKHGMSVEYYSNGQLKSEIMYVMGSPQGEVVKYYDNGQLAYKQLYANKESVGHIEAYAPDGSVLYKII